MPIRCRSASAVAILAIGALIGFLWCQREREHAARVHVHNDFRAMYLAWVAGRAPKSEEEIVKYVSPDAPEWDDVLPAVRDILPAVRDIGCPCRGSRRAFPGSQSPS